MLPMMCRRVRGLDATAARSFGTLASMLGTMGVQLLVTQLEPDSETARLLVWSYSASPVQGSVIRPPGTCCSAVQAAHGVTLRRAGDPASVGAYLTFGSLHDCMLHCETEYLKVRRHRQQQALLLAWA